VVCGEGGLEEVLGDFESIEYLVVGGWE